MEAKARHGTSNRAHVTPCLLLVAVNVSAALLAALLLVWSNLLPIMIALHGALMIVAWGCLLPLGGLVARYFKVTPTQNFPAVVDNPFWWNCHRVAQYCGVTLATGAVALVVRETGGHIDTLHGRCGLALMSVAWLQLLSPLFRGTKGGPTDPGETTDHEDRWRGDHFDMTRRRRLFESWHKPAGWALLIGAQAVILLGIDLVGSPSWLLALAGIMIAALGLAILDSCLRGRWISTHAALWGPGRDRSLRLR